MKSNFSFSQEIHSVVVAVRKSLGRMLSSAADRISQSDHAAVNGKRETFMESQEQFRILVDGLQDCAIFMLDPNGQVLSWNSGAEHIKGYKAAEIIGQHFSRFYSPKDIARGIPEEQLKIARTRGRFEQEGWSIRRNGSRFWAHELMTPLLDSTGYLRGFSKITRDMTERLRMESKYRGLLEASADAMVVVDQEGAIVLLNLQTEKKFGFLCDELIGEQITRIIPEGFAERLRTGVTGQRTVQEMGTGSELVGLTKDGKEFPIEIMLSPLESSEGVLITAAIRDITLRRESEEQLVEMSYAAQHDSLTKLANGALMNDRITQAVSFALRQRKQLAVLFINLDHFKNVNDSVGHVTADKLLQSVADRLTAAVRRSDTVSRQGSDEFVVLLSQVEHAEDAAFGARKILTSLAAPHRIDNCDLHINVSIGISTYPADGKDARSLMTNADTALHHAKDNGRNNYQFFRPDMHARVAERQLLEASLRGALGRNEFSLHYQPKVNLKSGAITGVEALLRWTRPGHGVVPPLTFIPIAEECGLILSIGRWVLLEACRQARAWRDLGLGAISVAVNVSAVEFLADDFLSGIRAALITTGMDPHNLELELTESALILDADSTAETLRALKVLGVQLAIDDFGTGYSSFSYLQRYSVDALKIDRSFLRDMDTNPAGAPIVSAMISIGKSLKHRVIAEGVETKEQLNFLQAHDCSEGQGYYFNRPMPADAFTELLKSEIAQAAVH
jgi:diguanylate cyclase (GGDEF)-like protein/PAS domain S-box-containing protein